MACCAISPLPEVTLSACAACKYPILPHLRIVQSTLVWISIHKKSLSFSKMAVNGEVAVAEMELDSPPSDRSPAEVMELDPRPSDLPTDNDQGLAVTGDPVGKPGVGTADSMAAGVSKATITPGDTHDPLNDSASDSDDGNEPAAGESAKSSAVSAEDKLVKAVSYKDRGNKCIAEEDSAGALKHYERGIKIASGLSSDEQVKALLVSLRLNLALACTKEQRYADAVSACTKVLEADSTNVKPLILTDASDEGSPAAVGSVASVFGISDVYLALFRRGVARARIGELEGAKVDLMAVIKADPRNGGAKKELKVLKERLVEHRKKEKASYHGLFDKGPMYNDKELERQKREAEAAKRLKEEEEEWGKSNDKRKAHGKEEQTLEDWRKEKKEAEEKAKKETEEREQSKPRLPPPKLPATPPKASGEKGEGGDEMELDEEDLKIIEDTKKQGYCYFKRTLSEKDQSLLDAEQMKLRARVSPATVQEKGEEPVAGGDATRSAWNEAGTWEEVEKTEWCKGKIREALGKVQVTVGKDALKDPEYLMQKLGGFNFAGGAGSGEKSLEAITNLKKTLAKLSARVTEVEIVGGDAHVICVSNKMKHIFDFNVKLKFSVDIDESMGLSPESEAAPSMKTFKGTLTFPDMTNSDADNRRFDSEPELKWDKGARWDAAYNERVTECITELKGGVLSALGSFFDEYKSS